MVSQMGTPEYKVKPPEYEAYQANPPATKAIPSATPEYKAICSCRVELTEKLSTCINDVAKYLRQSGALTDDQCQTIMISHEDSAKKLMEIIIVDIGDPDTSLDSFAYFLAAIKHSGTKNFQTFVKEKIEAKRKEFYRELLQFSPGM